LLITEVYSELAEILLGFYRITTLKQSIFKINSL